jgi:hypothetical protein
MTYLNTLVNLRTDAAILSGNKKNRKIAVLFLAGIFMFFLLADTTHAAVAGPGFTLDSVAAPTNFSAASDPFAAANEPGKCAAKITLVCGNSYEVNAMNAGSEPTSESSPVTITDTLPEGVTVQQVSLVLVSKTNPNRPTAISGTVIGEPEGDGESPAYTADCTQTPPVQCTFPEAVPPDDWLKMLVYVTVNNGVAEGTRLTNKATVSGGGAPTVSTEQTNQIGAGPAPFGPSNFTFYKDGLNGTEETQAGGHPYELTTTIDLDSKFGDEGPGREDHQTSSVENVKDIVVDLPLGFAGSTLAAPQCTEAQLDSKAHCPPETVVGHLTSEPVAGPEGGTTINGPIWNIVPERGHPAEFGYVDNAGTTHIAGYVSVVPTPAGYVLQFVASDIPEVDLNRIVVTFYGDPAKRDNTGAAQVPFFTNPTDCSGAPQVAKIWIDSWPHPAQFQPGSNGLIPANLEESAWKKMESVSPPVSGCNALQFTPAIGSQPTTHEADKPSGLEFEQRLAQSEIFGTDATPALKDTTITFPAGMTVDPSSANGLGTCSEAQIGWEGPTLFDFTQAPPACPESSKIGTLELETPLIPGILHGEVFLAAQNENPFKSTFATYIVVNDPVTGVVLKLAGEVKLNPVTGQLTAEFNETPQLPFSALRVHFFGGPRAEFATPPNCGTYTTTSILEPWSAPDSGLAGTPFDNYTIDQNCAIGFAPSFAALTTNVQAGEYTPFEGSFSREDDDQELQGLTMNLPPGMLANVGSATECGAAEIAAEAADAPTGGCPASSQVGTVTAEAGPGPNPLSVPGKIFWTGPYNGGPFGLAVVVSANPGPFHFGNVVVRQSLRINPETAVATDVSDAFPTFLHPVGANGQTDGIPIKLRRVDFDIDGRPGVGGWIPFTFNPANCNKTQVGGTITSTQGASKALEAPFQVTSCERLKYEPKLTVTTSAHTSKADGASLAFKIAYPKTAAIGNEAWFKAMKFTIPKQLPARLTTIQKACLAKVFEANPASCPHESVIGQATVHTEILPVALSGPLYFVSYGNQKFPEAVLVLQGDGVKLVVHGETFISHSGVTSATFRTVPEAPFESVEVSVPTGPFSEFAANGNLCAETKSVTVKKKVTVRVHGRRKTVTRKVTEAKPESLRMPIEFTASNGAQLKEETPIGVSGCPKAHAAKAKKKVKSAKRKRRK